MFTVSEAARRELHTYFLDREPRPMRVFLKEGSCGGPRLVLGIDELTEHDEIFTIAGLTYGVERAFFETIKPVRVDFVNNAFQVSAAVGTGGCAGCASSGGCTA